MSYSSQFFHTSPRSRRTRGFSMVEVILAVGILAVAIVALIGLIGPTLGAVRTVSETNAATSSISKLAAVVDAAPFYPTNDKSPTFNNDKYNCVYSWIYYSTEKSPTVFLFYDEVSKDVESPTPHLKIVRMNRDFPEIGSRYVNDDGVERDKEQMLTVFKEGRISGPVIAMSVSLSPLARNFLDPTRAKDMQLGDPIDANALWKDIYKPSTQAPYFLFSDNKLRDLGISDPNVSIQGSDASPLTTLKYPEAYLPIYVQVFSVPLDRLITSKDFDPLKDLTPGDRLFSYTMAKMR